MTRSYRCATALLFTILIVAVSCAFDCPALPAHTAKDVYDLRPNDIKVVMALGDSITAGFGIMGAEGDLNEFRGKSWAIGGDAGETTVPNFLRTYTPDLQGAAKGSHLLEYCAGPECPLFQYHPEVDVFDAAQSGAMVVNIPVHELDYLIRAVHSNPKINVTNDWKLLTIWIGANDLCSACDSGNESYTGPDAFEKYMTETLERVRTTMPRTFVNLVPMFNLSEVYTLGRKSFNCVLHQRTFVFECECIFLPNATTTRVVVDTYVQLYNQRLYKLADYYKKQNYSDFAAIIQPMLTQAHAAEYPVEFLSTFDCFHPSLLAHQNLAVALWNNMLTPAAQKKTELVFSDKPICPTPDTKLYIY